MKANPGRPVTIADVAPARTSKRLVRVVFEDGDSITVPKRAATNAGAAPGVTLLPAAAAQLRDDELLAARTRAVQRLSASDRSEREIRMDLRSYGFSTSAIDTTLDSLHRQRLLDDARMAEHFVASRTRTRPRSKRMLQAEMQARGIDATVAERATANFDDAASALDVAQRRAERAPTDSYQAFTAYVGPYLMRRGYDYSTAERAMNEVWQGLQQARNHLERTDSDD